jgi:hypothetical protein
VRLGSLSALPIRVIWVRVNLMDVRFTVAGAQAHKGGTGLGHGLEATIYTVRVSVHV